MYKAQQNIKSIMTLSKIFWMKLIIIEVETIQ